MLRGKLALGRRTFLLTHGESAFQSLQRGCGPIQGYSPHSIQRQYTATATPERVGAAHPARRRALAPHRLARTGNPRTDTSGGNGFSIQRRLRPSITRSLRTAALGRDGRRCVPIYAARCSGSLLGLDYQDSRRMAPATVAVVACLPGRIQRTSRGRSFNREGWENLANPLATHVKSATTV